MIVMMCSQCGVGYTWPGFARAKREGCWLCGNNWFYSTNPKNRGTMKARLEAEGRPIPDHLL